MLTGAVFLVAGLAYIAVGVVGRRSIFFIVGCAFVGFGARLAVAGRK